jgi:hypothetical protein
MTRKMMLCGAALLLGLGMAACGDDDSTAPDGGNQIDQAIGQDGGADTGITPDTGGTTPDTGGVTPDTGGTTPDLMVDSGGQTCTACHGTPPSTGKHTLHNNFKCSSCHSDVVDANNNIISTTLHKNGSKDVKGAFTWDSSAKSCAGSSCHGTKTW